MELDPPQGRHSVFTPGGHQASPPWDPGPEEEGTCRGEAALLASRRKQRASTRLGAEPWGSPHRGHHLPGCGHEPLACVRDAAQEEAACAEAPQHPQSPHLVRLTSPWE